MSDDLIFEPSEAAKARTFITKDKYEEMYARSISDPDGFWKEQSQRIDWIKAPTKIKNTSFAYPDVSIKWYEDGVLNISANCVDRHLETRGDQVAILWEGDTLEKRRAVRAYLKEHGYRIAQVTLDFEDYAWNDAYGRCVAQQDAAAIGWLKQSYLETADEYIRLGREEQWIAFGHEIPNVLLLHETAFTTLMLPDLLDLLRKQGFRFASLPDVEQDPSTRGTRMRRSNTAARCRTSSWTRGT